MGKQLMWDIGISFLTLEDHDEIGSRCALFGVSLLLFSSREQFWRKVVVCGFLERGLREMVTSPAGAEERMGFLE